MAGTGYLRGDYETTVGSEANASPTLSSKSIYIPATSASLALNPNPLERDDELRGVDEPLAVLEDTHRPTWELSTRAYPDVLGWLIKGACGAPTTTAGNGVITDALGVVVPTNAFRSTWTAPFGPSGNNPQTQRWTAAYKDQSVFVRGHGCATETLGFSVPETGGVGVTASGPLTYLQRISDPSLTPSYEALTIAPFMHSQLTISTDLTSETTAEGDFSFSITNPVEAVADLSSASRFPNTVYKQDGSIGLTGSVQRSLVSTAGWDALKAATSFSLTFAFTSTSYVTGTTPYKLIVKVGAAQYVGGGPSALAAQRRVSASYDWKSGYTGTAGNVQIQLINATSSYA